jgi:hypothetical protein
MAGPPPMGNPLAGGGLGVPPPMPGEGIDPYAALAGMISQTPPSGSPGMGGGPPGMPMPMDGGPEGMAQPGGLGMGMPGAGPQLGGPGGPPPDLIARALSQSAAPQSFPPNVGDNALDPEANQDEHMSMQQILALLSLLQGGIPSSGMPVPPQVGSASAGILPLGLGG